VLIEKKGLAPNSAFQINKSNKSRIKTIANPVNPIQIQERNGRNPVNPGTMRFLEVCEEISWDKALVLIYNMNKCLYIIALKS
jgi:hypothetical protein